MVVLNEIMADAGGMATNTAIVHHLLGRLEDFNEWGVCHVLALVSRLVMVLQIEGCVGYFLVERELRGCEAESKVEPRCSQWKARSHRRGQFGKACTIPHYLNTVRPQEEGGQLHPFTLR